MKRLNKRLPSTVGQSHFMERLVLITAIISSVGVTNTFPFTWRITSELFSNQSLCV